jgi:hypothetical protein
MSEIERDHVLRRAVQSLRQLPAADPDAIRRVVETAAAQRVMPAADDPAADAPPVARSGGRRWRLAGFAALVAAAAIVGFFVRGSVPPRRSTTSVPVASSAPSGGAPMRVAANADQDVVPIPQQFVFRSASARRVSVVGDFNGWSAARTPMTREVGGDLWSVTIPIAPGRHMYRFMVDDSTFTLDPDARVARARDPDLGVEVSVVIVGRP